MSKPLELPAQAIEHMSEQALPHLPDQIAPGPQDPGVLLSAGDPAAIYGAGWYHYGTSADQSFIGHSDTLDVYVLDFGLKNVGDTALPQGDDTIDHFEAGLDQWFSVNSGVVQDPNNYTAIVLNATLIQNPSGTSYNVDWIQDTKIDGVASVSDVPGQIFIQNYDFI